jgi:hypothetical protein
MVSMLASGAIAREFELRSGQTKIIKFVFDASPQYKGVSAITG